MCQTVTCAVRICCGVSFQLALDGVSCSPREGSLDLYKLILCQMAALTGFLYYILEEFPVWGQQAGVPSYLPHPIKTWPALRRTVVESVLRLFHFINKLYQYFYVWLTSPDLICHNLSAAVFSVHEGVLYNFLTWSCKS